MYLLIWELYAEAMPFEEKGCKLIPCFIVGRRERDAMKV
jgi:hypothetical protein